MMLMKNKYLDLSFAVFGLMCGLFGFFTELSGKLFFFFSTGFFLNLAVVSFLAAIYFALCRRD